MHKQPRRAAVQYVLIGRFATRTNVVFEEILLAAPSLKVESDESMLGGNWFRAIVLSKTA